MPTEEDPVDNFPPIVPARDEVVSRQQRLSQRNGSERRARTGGTGGTGLWSRLFITFSLVVAAVACAWAWQLQQELDRSQVVQQGYEARISDLEDRLSDTDEGMNQSSAALAVKIKELYSEVDKLWASAWRRNKAKIEALEKSASTHGSQLTTLSKTDKDYSTQLKKLGADIQTLNSVAGDLERLLKTARASEAQLERLGDDVNRMGLEYARLQKRTGGADERMDSIDAFRKQTNRSILQLRAQLAELQSGQPGAAPGAQ